MLKTVLIYGFALAAGAVALQKTHVARLFEKLRVARRTQAILLARELGLVR